MKKNNKIIYKFSFAARSSYVPYWAAVFINPQTANSRQVSSTGRGSEAAGGSHAWPRCHRDSNRPAPRKANSECSSERSGASYETLSAARGASACRRARSCASASRRARSLGARWSVQQNSLLAVRALLGFDGDGFCAGAAA